MFNLNGYVSKYWIERFLKNGSMKYLFSYIDEDTIKKLAENSLLSDVLTLFKENMLPSCAKNVLDIV